MLEYKIVRLPSEASLAVWENFLNSYAGDNWKLIHWSAGTIGSGPGYVILERMKSSDNRYSHIMDSGPLESAASRLREALDSPVPPPLPPPPKSRSNPIGGRAATALDTEL